MSEQRDRNLNAPASIWSMRPGGQCPAGHELYSINGDTPEHVIPAAEANTAVGLEKLRCAVATEGGDRDE